MPHPICEDFNTLAPPRPAQPKAAPVCPDESRQDLDQGPAPPRAPDEPSELAHYRILRLLGQGGMGKVYQAEDKKLQRLVALKVMSPDMTVSSSARDRFLREARAMAAVRNDHVVTIYEVGQADDTPYLAMEFLQGQTLDAWLKTTAPPIKDIVRIGREIAAGLAAAQTCGLIHRDIKPANLWLEAETGRVKILDFGLARPVQTNAGLTEIGDVIGTPSYMSPEQARGEQVDGRSDLFSLGVVLYQLCTQQLPFRGKTITAVLTALPIETPVPIRELNSNVPPPLAELIMRMLEKEPAKRPHAATSVIDSLRAIEGHVQLGSNGSHQRETDREAAKTPTLGPDAFSNTLAGAPRRPGASSSGPRRHWRFTAPLAAGFLLTIGLVWWRLTPSDDASASARNAAPATFAPAPAGPPIRLGVLYSRTGTMAISERATLDGVLLAVSEINRKGGVLGRTLETVIDDGQSDEAVFARKAAKLISEDKVKALFGTWTSASRKAVQAVVEQHDHLLFYPVSYEGMEQSPNIVYGGSVPNQQILPALKWSYGFLNKKRWFLAGLDSIYSRAAHAVVRDEALALGSQIVGEEVLADDAEIGKLVRQIENAKPDLIINTIKGDANVALFRALRRAAIRPDKTPTLSFALSEEELSSLPPDDIRGHYAAGNYFQSLELPRNQEFLRRVQERFDSERVVSDPMQTAYALVHLWAQAATAAGTEDVAAVRQAIKGQQFDAPQGLVTIDSGTLHTVQISRVGVVDERGRFIEVYASPRPIVPEPFPASRDRAAWEEFVQNLHRQWGGRWHNPGR
jgi:urea transport system substrate-binding protein